VTREYKGIPGLVHKETQEPLEVKAILERKATRARRAHKGIPARLALKVTPGPPVLRETRELKVTLGSWGNSAGILNRITLTQRREMATPEAESCG
jgi:hypothetical protein